MTVSSSIKYAVFKSSTMASRLSLRASDRMPWLPLLVSMGGDLLLRVFGTTLIPPPAPPRINVKGETGAPVRPPPTTGASDPRRLALPEALGPVALDVPAEVLDLLLCTLLGPAEVLDGHLCGGLVDVEGDVRAEADHRAPRERRGQRPRAP